MIFHLVWEIDWQSVASADEYAPPSLQSEGFVHATKEPEKLAEVANQFYDSELHGPLLILVLDEAEIPAPIRYEDPGVGHLFPHIYGPIPKTAVAAVERMERRDGKWTVPDRFSEPGSSM